MKRLWLTLALSFSVALSGCAGCNDDGGGGGGGDADTALCPVESEPVIVRTEFDPKTGKAPLTVRFNVVGEDDDLDFCADEELRYHFDFDGDGFEDGKPRKSGKNVDYTYEKPGDYRVTIWVTDAADQASAKVNKFIKVGANEPPVLSRLTALPNQGAVPLFVQFDWLMQDPDGKIESVEVDFGDGATFKDVATDDDPNVTNRAVHTYTKLGTHTVKVKICDEVGACDEATTSVGVYALTLPSNFVQTIGTSRAIAINDNGGAHFDEGGELVDYGLIADGYIGLKVVRYPLAAFSVTAPTAAAAELVGWADPGGISGFARDVVTYDNLAVVAGDEGMFVYNVFSEGNPCTDSWDTNCYPGAPTAPVAYCSAPGTAGFFAADFSKVALVQPSGSGQTWAFGLAQPGAQSGGVLAIRLDLAAASPGSISLDPLLSDPSYAYNAATGRLDAPVFTMTDTADPVFPQRAMAMSRLAVGDIVRSGTATATITSINYDTGSGLYWVGIGANVPGFAATGSMSIYRKRRLMSDCWTNTQLTQFGGFASALGRVSNDVAVDGDTAYIALNADGLLAVDLGSALKNLVCNTSTCFENQVKWRLNVHGSEMRPALPADGNTPDPRWTTTQHTGHALAITESRPIAEAIPATAFLPAADLNPNLTAAKFKDCAEPPQALAAATASTTHALLQTARRFLPGNAVTISTATGVLTNNGAGFTVTGNVGNHTVIAGDFSAANPATWSTAALHGVESYAKLPAYPGNNPVSFTGYQAAKIGRNAVCLNFVNAYEPITSPVGVSFNAAPLLVAALSGTLQKGIFVFDRSDPYKPLQLTRFTQPTPMLVSEVETNLAVHDEWLYVSWGLNSGVQVLDISDPYHLLNAYDNGGLAKAGVFHTASGWTFAANEMLYRVTPNNPEGVLLVASGAMGVSAMYTAPYLAISAASLQAACPGASAGNACTNYVPGLQLRHEGLINDIKLVDNRYALVAQQRGGVLVFDVSGVTNGGDPMFMSHIKTKDDPKVVRVVDDGSGGDLLFIADSSSFYRIPLTDPARPGLHVGSIVTGKVPAFTGYDCVDASVGKVFGCATIYRNSISGQEHSYPQPATPSVYAGGRTFFANGMNIPAYEVLTSYGSLGNVNTCVFDAGDILYDSGTTRMWSDMLNGRLFLFAESTYGLKFSEVRVGGGGAPILVSEGGRQVAQSCLWWVWNPEKLAAYQNRPGVWKRLYGADNFGAISVYDIDALEDRLADSAFNPVTGRNVARTAGVDLAQLNTPAGMSVPIRRIVTAGPYLFIGAGTTGAWVLDVSDAFAPKLIGRTAISVPGMNVSALNVIPYADLSGGTYTYLALISDNRESGGIRLIRYPGLAAP